MTRRSGINAVRRALHLTERALGDINAARRGRLGKRLVHRHITRRALRPWTRIFK